jgi:xanthine dehydrogenase YagT iron-sulfur-binding subunit
MNQNTDNRNKDTSFYVTRRTVLEAGTVAAALSFVDHSQPALGAGSPSAEPPLAPVTVGFQVNGRHQTLTLDLRTTLLDALRAHRYQEGMRPGAMWCLHRHSHVSTAA